MINIKKQADMKAKAFKFAQKSFKDLSRQYAIALIPATGVEIKLDGLLAASKKLYEWIMEGQNATHMALVPHPSDPTFRNTMKFQPSSYLKKADYRAHYLGLLIQGEKSSGLNPRDIDSYISDICSRCEEIVEFVETESNPPKARA